MTLLDQKKLIRLENIDLRKIFGPKNRTKYFTK